MGFSINNLFNSLSDTTFYEAAKFFIDQTPAEKISSIALGVIIGGAIYGGNLNFVVCLSAGILIGKTFLFMNSREVNPFTYGMVEEKEGRLTKIMCKQITKTVKAA